MELLIFTTYHAILKKRHENIEMYRGGVTCLLERIMSKLHHKFPQFDNNLPGTEEKLLILKIFTETLRCETCGGRVTSFLGLIMSKLCGAVLLVN